MATKKIEILPSVTPPINFIPRRRYIYICPRVHLSTLIFIQYGLLKLSFKNTILHRPLFDPKIFIMDGGGEWMDGWMESFFFFFLILKW